MDKKKQIAVDFLIESLEGIKLHAYLDVAGLPSIGIGTRYYTNGQPVKMGDICTESDAFIWLNYHLDHLIYPVLFRLCAGYNVSDKVFAALTSLAYNCGSAVLKEPEINEALKTENLNMLADIFRRYDKIHVDGIKVISKGLQERREKEIAYFTGK